MKYGAEPCPWCVPSRDDERARLVRALTGQAWAVACAWLRADEVDQQMSVIYQVGMQSYDEQREFIAALPSPLEQARAIMGEGGDE